MPLSVDQCASAVVKSGLMTADEMKALWATIPAADRPKDGDGLGTLRKLFEQAGRRGSLILISDFLLHF